MVKTLAMMQIIVFFSVTSLLLVACGDVQSQKPFTIGMINYVSVLDPVIEGFKTGMSELGYVDGENVSYIYNGNVEPDSEAVDIEIENLLAENVDMLFTVGNLTTFQAKQAVLGTEIPVVFGAIVQPIEEGVVTNLRQPGGNLTGITNGQGTAKALEWLAVITPGAKKMYVPYNPADEVSVAVLTGLEGIPSQLGIELVLGEVRSVEEAVVAIENLPEDVDAIFRIPSPTLDPRNEELSRAAIKRGLPLGSSLKLDETVLLTYAADFFEVGKQAARLAHQIRQGVKSGDLPVETAEFFLTINYGTAEAIGLNIPENILLQANTVIR